MLIDLGVNSRAVYEEDFEKRFLEESDRFYTAEAQAFLEANNCADYMRKVAQRLKEELERVEHYLDKSTEPKIKAVCEDQLIARHRKTLVDMDNSGLVPMLRDDKIEDLNRMFSLFGRISDGTHSFLYSSILASFFSFPLGHAHISEPASFPLAPTLAPAPAPAPGLPLTEQA